jgi:hypothetical protein
MFSIDGITWDIPCDITRVSEITASNISGILMDGTYFNDVIGTYLSYTVKLAVPLNMMQAYARLYETLTQAVEGHDFVFPYNRSTAEVHGRVTNISDVYVRMPNNGIHWTGIQFQVISNIPAKRQTLTGAINRGIPVEPDVSEPQIGDTYTYTENGWVAVNS